MVPAGNKAKSLSSVNHTTKTNHHHYQRKILTVSPSSESDDSSISKLNWINTLEKKRLLDKFYEGDYENENVQVPEGNDLSDKDSDKRISDFLSCDDSCDN